MVGLKKDSKCLLRYTLKRMHFGLRVPPHTPMDLTPHTPMDLNDRQRVLEWLMPRHDGEQYNADHQRYATLTDENLSLIQEFLLEERQRPVQLRSRPLRRRLRAMDKLCLIYTRALYNPAYVVPDDEAIWKDIDNFLGSFNFEVVHNNVDSDSSNGSANSSPERVVPIDAGTGNDSPESNLGSPNSSKSSPQQVVPKVTK